MPPQPTSGRAWHTVGCLRPVSPCMLSARSLLRRRRMHQQLSLSAVVLVSACTMPARPPPGPDPCGDRCSPPTSCSVVSDGPGFWGATTSLTTCTQPCVQNIDCSALGEGARCSRADRCVLPCTNDAECAVGTCTAENLCGIRATGTSDVGARWDVGAPIAMGASVFRATLDCARAGHLAATSSNPAVVQIVGIDVSDPDCAAVRVHGLAVGASIIDVRVDGVSTERWEIRVRAATLITLTTVALWGGGLGPVDLERATGDDRSLGAIARDAEGARLVLGDTVAWSLDDPSLGRLEPWRESEFAIAVATLRPSATGTTTLRVRFEDLERAIPIEIAPPE